MKRKKPMKKKQKKIASKLSEEQINTVVDKIMENISPTKEEDLEEEPKGEQEENPDEGFKEDQEENPEEVQDDEVLEDDSDDIIESSDDDLVYSDDEEDLERLVFGSDKKATRGQQLNRKDKDLMDDTGGGSYKRKEPKEKPPRYDLRNPWSEKNKKPGDLDKDIDNDPDLKRMAKKLSAGFLADLVEQKKQELSQQQGTCPEGHSDTGDGCESPDGLWFPYEE